MKRAALLTLIPMALGAAGLQIDHVTVAGKDLKKLQAALVAAGIETVYGGAHSNQTTEMALASFPDGSYLELIALQPGATAGAIGAHVWGKYLEGDAGPCAWAVRVQDMAAEVKRLQAAGARVGTPERSGRARPDGVRLEWETLDIGAEARGTFFPFLIHDLTPREQRVFPQGKPVTRDFRGVARVAIAVRNLDEAVGRYRRAFGLPGPIKQVDREFGAQLAIIGDAPVVLAQPLTADSWLAARLEQFGEGPCAFVLAASRPGRYAAAAKSRWFGAEIAWFDAGALGWRLGFQDAR